MTERIGFVGLGNMGQPMALNLLKADYDLIVYDLDEWRITPLAALGASQAFRLRDVGEPGGTVVTMVPTDASLLDVALGGGGLLEKLCPGGIHLSLSTVSPEVSAQLAALYTERGGTFLAGTVLGHPDVAAQAALSIYLSGPAAAKERVLPLLQVLGRRVYDLGEDAASANVLKLGATFLILAALVAMGEAAALVEGHGVDRQLFLHSMAESPLFGGAVYPGLPAYDIIDNIVPYIGGEEEKMEGETRKLLGHWEERRGFIDAPVAVSARCTRVPTREGHLECASVELARDVDPGAVVAAWESYQGEPQRLNLPSAPPSPLRYCFELDRPQPVWDHDAGGGMTVTLGRLRPCSILGYKFVLLGHNTIRGAAGGSILNAELCVSKGYV